MVYFPGGNLPMAFHCTWHKIPNPTSVYSALYSLVSCPPYYVSPARWDFCQTLDQGALPSPKSPAPFVSLLPYPFDLYQSFVSQLKVGSTETLFLIPNCFLHFPFIAREMKAVYYVEFLCVVNFFKVGLPTGL